MRRLAGFRDAEGGLALAAIILFTAPFCCCTVCWSSLFAVINNNLDMAVRSVIA